MKMMVVTHCKTSLNETALQMAQAVQSKTSPYFFLSNFCKGRFLVWQHDSLKETAFKK